MDGPNTTLNVLISAYACRPDTGSEHEIGWQWPLHMARFADVTVLTRTANRQAIEEGLAQLAAEQPRPRFIFHEASCPWLHLKRLNLTPWLYYCAWQRSARSRIGSLTRERQFDLLHHLSWGEMRSRPAIWGHGKPSIWGPVNGVEATPRELLPWRYPRDFAHELCRSAANRLVLRSLSARIPRGNTILVSTRETQRAFAHAGVETILFPEIGLNERPLPERESRTGPLRLLYEGRVVFYKGLHLAIAGLAASRTQATLTVVGNGPFRPAAERLARKLGLTDRVTFHNSAPFAEILHKHHAEADVFVFPSLHDSGGFSVLEAMASGLPVICADSGGPGIAVESSCGFRVALGSPDETVAAIADAIRQYDRNRLLAIEHGRNAWRTVMDRYLWERKAAKMNEIYQRAARACNHAVDVATPR